MQFLFGFHELSILHPKNFIILVLKKYIWTTKFKTKQLELVGFLSYAKPFVTDLMYILEKINKKEIIREWITVVNTL